MMLAMFCLITRVLHSIVSGCSGRGEVNVVGKQCSNDLLPGSFKLPSLWNNSEKLVTDFLFSSFPLFGLNGDFFFFFSD